MTKKRYTQEDINRAVHEALAERGWTPEQLAAKRADLEAREKSLETERSATMTSLGELEEAANSPRLHPDKRTEIKVFVKETARKLGQASVPAATREPSARSSKEEAFAGIEREYQLPRGLMSTLNIATVEEAQQLARRISPGLADQGTAQTAEPNQPASPEGEETTGQSKRQRPDGVEPMSEAEMDEHRKWRAEMVYQGKAITFGEGPPEAISEEEMARFRQERAQDQKPDNRRSYEVYSGIFQDRSQEQAKPPAEARAEISGQGSGPQGQCSRESFADHFREQTQGQNPAVIDKEGTPFDESIDHWPYFRRSQEVKDDD
ncbi:MAG: hypothetical protein ACLFVD_01170 [Dehalococcoidia bacterium]